MFYLRFDRTHFSNLHLLGTLKTAFSIPSTVVARLWRCIDTVREWGLSGTASMPTCVVTYLVPLMTLTLIGDARFKRLITVSCCTLFIVASLHN